MDRSGSVLAELKILKHHFVSQNDEVNATMVWAIETMCEARTRYGSAFLAMKGYDFYNAWCALEQAELRTLDLKRQNLLQADSLMGLIDRLVNQFQALYPYKEFQSIEFLKKRVECSICRQVITPWEHCDHEHGKIYQGEMCGSVIVEAELIGSSTVTSPRHKYAVNRGKSMNYDYSVVKYVIDALHSPFDEWNVEWTTLDRPQSHFTHIGRNGKCPCRSGKKFKLCCRNNARVDVPHLALHLSKPPNPDLPKIVYLSDSKDVYFG